MTRALLVAGLLTLAFAGQAHALPSDVKLGCLSGRPLLARPRRPVWAAVRAP